MKRGFALLASLFLCSAQDAPLNNQPKLAPAAQALIPYPPALGGATRGAESPERSALRAGKATAIDWRGLDIALESGALDSARMRLESIRPYLRSPAENSAWQRRAQALPASPAKGAAASTLRWVGEWPLTEQPAWMPARRVAPGIVPRPNGGWWTCDGQRWVALGPKPPELELGPSSAASAPHGGRHAPLRWPIVEAGEQALSVIGGGLVRSDGTRGKWAEAPAALEYLDLAQIGSGRFAALARSGTDPRELRVWWLEWEVQSLRCTRAIELYQGADPLILDYAPPLSPPARGSPAGGIGRGTGSWTLDAGLGVLVEWDPHTASMLSWTAAARRSLEPWTWPPAPAWELDGAWHWEPHCAPWHYRLQTAGTLELSPRAPGQALGALAGQALRVQEDPDGLLLLWGNATPLGLGAPGEALRGYASIGERDFVVLLERSVVLGRCELPCPKVLSRVSLTEAWLDPASLAWSPPALVCASAARTILLAIE